MEAVKGDLEIYHRMRLEAWKSFKVINSDDNGRILLKMSLENDCEYLCPFEKLPENVHVVRYFSRKEILDSISKRKSTVDQDDLESCREFFKQPC